MNFKRVLMVGAALFFGGCAQSTSLKGEKAFDKSRIAGDVTTPEAIIAADPVAYIHRVATNTRKLEQYTVILTRSERLGLFRRLAGPERIACWYRRRPFSVRLKWLDEDVKYGESVYCETVEKGRVRFTPRNGFLGLPPAVTVVDVQTPVAWGEARFPLTSFGLERMMERTLDALARSGDEAHVSYLGLVEIEGVDDPVHHMHIEYPPEKFPDCRLELYVDALTDLPVGSVLRTESGRLEGSYTYSGLNAGAALRDEDFLLDAERAAAAETATDEGALSRPTSRTEPRRY